MSNIKILCVNIVHYQLHGQHNSIPEASRNTLARCLPFPCLQQLRLLSLSKFSEYFRETFIAGYFSFKNKTAVTECLQTKWVVYCGPSLANAEHVVRYLGQYTHRVAITNQRILNIADGKVTFLAKDYRDRAIKKPVTLDGVEFSFDASGIFAAVDRPAIGFSFGTLISQNAGFAGRGGVSLKPESRRSFFP